MYPVLDKLSAEHHRNRKLIDELEQAEARFTETTWEIDGVEYSNETLGVRVFLFPFREIIR